MKMSILSALAISTILAAALALSGCGSKDNSEVKQLDQNDSTKATVNQSNGKMEIKTAKGETMEIAPDGGAKLPDGFPKDVYVYEGAGIKQSVKADDSFNVMLETADAKQKVIDKCKSKLESQGWKQAVSVDSGDSTVFQYEKGNLKAGYVFSQSDGKTAVMITVTEEKSGDQ